jgi:hypothetical protein
MLPAEHAAGFFISACHAMLSAMNATKEDTFTVVKSIHALLGKKESPEERPLSLGGNFPAQGKKLERVLRAFLWSSLLPFTILKKVGLPVDFVGTTLFSWITASEIRELGNEKWAKGCQCQDCNPSSGFPRNWF